MPQTTYTELASRSFLLQDMDHDKRNDDVQSIRERDNC